MGSDGYDPDEMLRLFYAVMLPAELTGGLAELQQGLDTAGVRVSWVRPANMHFTIKFLGEVPARLVEILREVGAEAVGECEPLRVELSGVGAFPSAQRPQTIWVGATVGVTGLEQLAAAVEGALRRRGLVLGDARPFVAHCSLGRVRDRRGAGDLPRLLAREERFSAGCLESGELQLMKSELSRSGPTYDELASFRLGGESWPSR